MKLESATAIAERIIGELDRYCDRIEIAGSVRRGRAWVNDIDFVVQIRAGDMERFRARVTSHSTIVKDGPEILILRLKDGTQVDFYFAHGPSSDLLTTAPGNFGTVLLCRTGSKEHNIHLAQRAQQLGLKWETMRGVTREGQVIASETEEEIFTTLDLPFIKPEQRER